MITIEVNGKEVKTQEGRILLEVLRGLGIDIPTLCYVKDLFPSGACRMCVVEVEGQKNLVPSCASYTYDGMKIWTHSSRVLRARKTIVELLLSSHPDDCLYCIRNGNCELQDLASQLGVRERRYIGPKKEHHIDASSPSIVRDPAKCILCGRCVRICEEVQGVSAIDFVGRGSAAKVAVAFDRGLNVSSCIKCGQCIMVCPTGALRERSALKEVTDAINDPNKLVVVQHAPSISVSIGEEFGLRAGTDVDGVLVRALRILGFDRVFDTSFSADLTIMEEASELVERVKKGGVFPMFTSCCPAWVKFVEQFYPEFIPNLSSCKSPQQMLGAIIKSYFAEREGIAVDRIYSVSIMPCSAKKFEAERPEMARGGIPDVDAVLTTRELARMIRRSGLDITKLEPDTADTPFGTRSSAGKLFGATGGVMEAAIRSAYYFATGKELEHLEVKPVRGLEELRRTTIEIDGIRLGVGVVYGLANARKLLEAIRDGFNDIHFVEVMACPGGCIGGGGQPINTTEEAIRRRMKALYSIDATDKLRASHRNPDIKRIYEEFLEAPLGKRSHEYLHTKYMPRQTNI